MRDTIQTKDLKLGMYVVIPSSWLKPPFLNREFKISSQEQIDKIMNYGLATIVIDTEKGIFTEKTATPPIDSSASKPPRTWEPDKLVPLELREAIHDKKLPSVTKSKIVYKCSLDLMGRLFEDPKTENIREAKAGIAEIVDLVISDDATSAALLKITSHDFYTYTHSVNVGVLSVLLCKSFFGRSDAHDLHELGAGFFLHDIGKVRIDPAIINKRGKLTAPEFSVMRTHPDQGYAILSETKQLTEECKIIVIQHHERQDGSGYPRRLSRDEIHAYGRICSIADVFDALTSERSYQKKLDTFSALKLMKEQLLEHFHQDMFEKFVLLFTEHER
jgi:HD-GYP domain-containing protein (c-di-GMP phosphodiesterase class II)